MNTQSKAFTLSKVDLHFTRKRLFRHAKTTPVLKSISFQLNKGESLGILGLNGAGKSSLLRLMAGIFEPDGGTLTNHGVSSSLLTLTGGIFPECSGRANTIMLLMLQQGLSRNQASLKIDQIAAYAELEDYIDAPLWTYSNGMISRLKFAIATQADPDVLLVDEILAVGDFPFLKKSMQTMQEKLTSGDTVVFVSHNVEVIRDFCKRALWLDNGRIVEDGDAENVVKNYVTHTFGS